MYFVNNLGGRLRTLSLILTICLSLSLFNPTYASSTSMSGAEVFDEFLDFESSNVSKNFLKNKEINFAEFLQFYYQSFDLKTPKFYPVSVYKLVRGINYRSQNAKYLYYAIKQGLVKIESKSFDFKSNVKLQDLQPFIEHLDSQGLSIEGRLETDYYDNFFKEVYEIVARKFYFADQVTKQSLMYGAVKGMVTSLDDKHSSFQTPAEKQLFLDSLNQDLEGIGASIMINEDRQFQVISPLKGSPALKAGLLPGDIIIAVNGIEIAGKTLSEGINMIKGPKNTRVKLTIKRGTNFLTLNIVRQKIEIPLVSGKILDEKQLLIDIRSFSHATAAEVTALLSSTDLNSIENIIIDLRSNPGGFLQSVIDVAELFLDKDLTIVSTKKSSSQSVSFKSERETINDKPIIFLINKGTASSSEIFVLALQEYLAVTVYGETSYGKGTVQELISFTDDSALKLTVGEWLSPSGVSINGIGIVPDIEVLTNPDDVVNENDPVLNQVIRDISSS